MAPKRKAEAVNGASASASKTSKAAGNQATDASWLKPGDPCPDFKAVTHDKEDFSLHEHVKEKGAVIFIYPKANTPGCTKQARGFRDNFEDIQRAGYQVFGLSADNAGPQTNWRNKEQLPFALLTDRNKSQLRELGFLAGDKIMRGHIVVGKRGVVQQYCAGVKPLDSVSSATNFCLQKGQEGDSDEGEGETG